MAWGSGNLGGGASLNYRVKNGTSQPSGADNLIWVNTSVAIKTTVFDKTQPVGAEGMLWVQLADTSTLELEAVKTNSNKIVLYLAGARLYTNGAWELIAAYIYQNNSWTQFSFLFGPDAWTYTGEYEIADNVMYLKTSGTFVTPSAGNVDVFLIGGGAGGAFSSNNILGGGGSGYTVMGLSHAIAAGQFSVVIGAGGAAGIAGSASGKESGATSAFGLTANGGALNDSVGNGGAGASGGGSNGAGGVGGSNGSNGGNGISSGGTGQGSTTRIFGETTGRLVGGGGGGAVGTGSANAGGAGGGGNGALNNSTASATPAGNGEANTGGGGGGGGGVMAAGAGGSGLVAVRIAA